MRRLLVPFVLVALFVSAGYGLWQMYARAQTSDVPVPTEQLVVVDIVARVVATGAIVPREEVALKPRVTGVIREILAKPGDRVTQGQPIARVRVIANQTSLADAESRVRASKLALADEERKLAQLERLETTRAVSAEEVRAAQLVVHLAREELRGSREALRALRDGALRQGESAANVVFATIAGTVLAVPVKVGASVIDSNSFNEGTTVATIADMDDLIFQGWVDESDVGVLREGMPLTLVIAAIDGLSLDGSIERIAPKGELRQGVQQFEVRAAVRPPEGHTLRAGYSANATIVIDEREQVLAIPEKLLQFDERQPFVEVMTLEEPPTFERRDVELGLSDGIHAELLGGVEADAHIKLPTLTAAEE